MRLFSVATAALALLSGFVSAAGAAGAEAAAGGAPTSSMSDPAVIEAMMMAEKLFPPCTVSRSRPESLPPSGLADRDDLTSVYVWPTC